MLRLFRKNKNNISLIVVIFLGLNLFHPVLVAVDLSTSIENAQLQSVSVDNYDPYMRAAKFYLPSLVKKEQVETELQQKIKAENEQIAKSANVDVLRNIGKMSDLGQVETLRLTYNIFSKPQKYSKPKHVFVDDSAFTGLEFFCGKSNETREKNWFASIDRTITPFGKVALQAMFTKGFDSVEQQAKKAQKTQALIKYLVQNKKAFNELGAKLKDISAKAPDLMFMFKPFDDKTQGTLNQFFFKSAITEDFTRFCNENPLGYKLANNSLFVVGLSLCGLFALLPISVIAYSHGIGLTDKMQYAKYIPTSISGLMLLGHLKSGLCNAFINKKSAILGSFLLASMLSNHFGRSFLKNITDSILRYGKMGSDMWTALDAKTKIDIISMSIGLSVGLVFGLTTLYLNNKRNGPAIEAIKQAKSFVETKAKNIATLTNTIYEVEALCQNDKFLNESFKSLGNNLSTNQIEENVLFNELMDLYSSIKDDKGPIDDTIFSMKLSRVFAAFKKTHRLAGGFTKRLKQIGKLDAYWSLAQLYKEHADSTNAKYCFVDFVESDRPYLNIKEYWFPMLNPRWVITNDVEMGAITKNSSTQGSDNNDTKKSGCATITGPNAGGKTINLKGIMSAVIMATRTGIAPASSMKLTQFARIDSHMEVADMVGSMSRFESEKNSAVQFLETVKQLKPNEFQLELMDEIFSSTNPEEGQSLAYAIASSLVDNPNCMCFIATHFKKLTELEKVTSGYYKNYKVTVTMKPDGTLYRPYKLELGISDQNVAILMCKDKFGSKITDTAYQILSQVKTDTSDIVGYSQPIAAN